jgi:hypothetical protein
MVDQFVSRVRTKTIFCVTEWAVKSSSIELAVMVAVLVLYNGATIKLLTVGLGQVDLKQALVEKAPTVPDETSYSRLAGLIGAVVLATFFWAVGNVVIYRAFVAPASIGELLSHIGTFFLGGASLFLPYAFNQLREAFRPK